MSGEVISTAGGRDLTVPGWVSEPRPGTGAFTMDTETWGSPPVEHRGMVFRWLTGNPSEGVYDFSQLLDWLDDAQTAGVKFVVRAKFTTIRHTGSLPAEQTVPQWALDKHSPTEVDLGDIIVWNPFDSDMWAEYFTYLENIPTEVLEHPALLMWVVHFVSRSRGEEFGWDSAGGTQMVSAGMTPTTLLDVNTAHMDKLIEVFGANAHKLAFLCTGSINPTSSAYTTTRKALDAYPTVIGIGRRQSGLPEDWSQRIGPSSGSFSTYVGLTPNAQGYAVQDQAWREIVDPAPLWYAEHEERSGSEAYEYEMALWRLMMQGVRQLWTNRTPPATTVLNYWRMRAGRHVTGGVEVFDAWSKSYSTDLSYQGNPLELKNWEDGLYQRASTGYTPVRANETARDALDKDAGAAKDWTEWRTDQASGNTRIGYTFSATMPALAGRSPVVKVTWRDTGGTWRLRYSTASGEVVSDNVVGSNAGLVTTTIETPNLRPTQQVGGYDLAVEWVSGNNIAVDLVRVVLTAASGTGRLLRRLMAAQPQL